MYGDLAGLCPEYVSLNTHDITDVHPLECLICILSQFIPGHIQLDISFQILQISEGCLTHDTLGHETSGDGDIHPILFGDLGSFLPLSRLRPLCVKCFLCLRCMTCHVVFRDHEGILSRFLQLGQLLSAHLEQLIQILLGCLSLLLILLFSHSPTPFPFPLRDIFDKK